MGWMAPLRHQCAKLVFSKNHQEREPSMSEITTVGLDLAKRPPILLCQVPEVDIKGRANSTSDSSSALSLLARLNFPVIPKKFPVMARAAVANFAGQSLLANFQYPCCDRRDSVRSRMRPVRRSR
jgi:hypothetical protein